ncbi:MAG: TetR/AcrR family transcriptional regulator [Bacteroidota bacterium]
MARDDQKRRVILAARERMFREGFSRMSIDVLVSDLGMSKKTFYKIFRSKEDLVSQIVDNMLGEVRLVFGEITGSDRDFLEKLTAILTLVGEQIGRIGRPLQEDLQKLHPELWKRIEDFRRQRLTQTFAPLFDQGIAEGYVRSDVNKRVFLFAYIGAIQNLITPQVLVQESFSAQDALRGIVGIFFQGILTDQGRKQLAQIPIVKTSPSI